MDKKEIAAIWQAYLDVQEGKGKKKEALDPVGKEDGDIDNDGDKDSSDEYLAKRRKAVGKAIDKDKEQKEGKLPPALQKAIDKKKGKKTDDEEEEVKSESTESDKEECPKCKGKGCEHCDDKGYHSKKESYDLSDQELLDELTDKDRATIAKRKQMRSNPSTAAKMKGRPTAGKSARAAAIRGRRMEGSELFSDEELAAIDEKMQPNSNAAPGEKHASTASAGEKKFADDHKKSDPKLARPGDGESAVAAGRASKQSPGRRGDNSGSGDKFQKVK